MVTIACIERIWDSDLFPKMCEEAGIKVIVVETWDISEDELIATLLETNADLCILDSHQTKLAVELKKRGMDAIRIFWNSPVHDLNSETLGPYYDYKKLIKRLQAGSKLNKFLEEKIKWFKRELNQWEKVREKLRTNPPAQG